MRLKLPGRLAGCLVFLALVGGTPPLSSAQGIDSLLGAGDEALEAGEAETAEELFRRVLLAQPDRVQALLGWGRALAAQGQGGSALASLLGAAERRLEAAVYAEAVALLELAVKIDPWEPAVQARLGRALILHRRFLAAEAPLREALSQGPREPQWLLHLAAVLWEVGRLSEAESLYREAVEQAPAAGVTWQELGRFLLWRGLWAEAAQALAQAERRGAHLALERAQALAGLGAEASAEPARVARSDELLQEALAAYRTAVEEAPEHAQARYGLAQVLLKLGHGDEARLQFGIYRRLHEEEQVRLRRNGLGRAKLDHASDLVRRGRTAEAVAYLESLPTSNEVLEALALAQHRLAAISEGLAEPRESLDAGSRPPRSGRSSDQDQP